MADIVYEGMFILDAAQYSRNPDEASATINQMIEEAGGEILVSRVWVDGKRLAYPINGQRKGTYWLTYFRMDSLKLGELNRKSQLSTSVLRHLFLKIDPRIVDMLVEHARTGRVVAEEGATEAQPATPAPASEAASAPAPEKAAEEAGE